MDGWNRASVSTNEHHSAEGYGSLESAPILCVQQPKVPGRENIVAPGIQARGQIYVNALVEEKPDH